MGQRLQRRFTALLFLFSTALLIATPGVYAGYGCPGYFSYLPSVNKLAFDGSTVRAVTGVDTESNFGTMQRCPADAPKLTLTRDEALTLQPELADYVKPGTESYRAGPNQEMVGCVKQGDYVYFGISFYGAEGEYGVGGLGRYHAATKAMEVRRPKELLDTSVFRLVHDGESMWMSAGYEGEYTQPAHGLVRYQWEANKLTHYHDSDEGPCGKWIQQLVVRDGAVWAANDLGASHYKDGKWQHFVPDSKGVLQPTTCKAVYQKLLATLPDETDPRDGACALAVHGKFTPRNMFRTYFLRYRPTLFRRLDRK